MTGCWWSRRGIYDVDEFFDVLREEPLDQWYEIGNVIAILDARLEKNLSQQADYLLASEAANAGKSDPEPCGCSHQGTV